MTKSDKELVNRDAQRVLGAELLESVQAIKAGKVGKVNLVPVSIAAEARQRLGPPRAEFATVRPHDSGLEVGTP